MCVRVYVCICMCAKHTQSLVICSRSHWQMAGTELHVLFSIWLPGEKSQFYKTLSMQNQNDKLNPLKSGWFYNLGCFISMKIVKLDFFFPNPLIAPAIFITRHLSWHLIISPLCCYLFYGYISCFSNWITNSHEIIPFSLNSYLLFGL